MPHPVHVLLPPTATARAVAAVQEAGAVPVLDCVGGDPEVVPDGAWVRVRAGRRVPGTGPVILAEPGEPVPGRPTWLETPLPTAIPTGFAGIVLKGSEAGGRHGEASGAVLLARAPDPGRVLLDADMGPESASVAAARGAGLLVTAGHLGTPEISLPKALADRLGRPDDEATTSVKGVRVGHGPTAAPVRALLGGADPLDLARGVWEGRPDALWLAGKGISRARDLAHAHGSLTAVVRAYVDAFDGALATSPGPDLAAQSGPAPAVAIVGVGCRLPGAADVAAFWRNVVDGVGAIGEVPPDRWDPALFFDPDPEAPDRTYTKIGGFLRDFRFDGRRFRIPPKVAEQIDPVQQITLESVADALADAGLQVDRSGPGRAFDRERCAVILGNSLGGEIKDRYAVRLEWPEVERKLRTTLGKAMPPDVLEQVLDETQQAYKADLPVVTEDSMPGELSNVIAGRIANAFDLGGANFTVDAACASSMAAVQAAVKGLQDGDFDVAITGGADRSMNLPTYVKFCKIGALSPDHSAPFDASANGFVMGEGCAILVMKRLDDAVRDGDRVYAVVRGIGASSDGKGKGITAPNIAGQIRALTRAYEDAGVDPWTVDLVEAHGTSTTVGDKVEIEALNEVIGSGHRPPADPIRIGSVKSMIGHLKSAAGAASILKAALALHHRVLPPSLGYRTARPDVPLGTIPLQVQTRAEPWPARPGGVRRAGVSAFGFGGTNFHVVLESWAGQDLQARPSPRVPVAAPVPAPAAVVAAPVSAAPVPAALVAPSPDLPEGIWATSGADTAEVLGNLRRLAAGQPAPFEASAPWRVAAAFDSPGERAEQIGRAIAALEKGTHPDMLRARGIHVQDGPVDGLLAVTFTGQGSQYPDMGRDLAAEYPVVAETFAEADRILAPTLGKPLTAFVYTAEGEDPDEKDLVLRRTEYSQPATLAMDVAILRLLAAYGVYPDMVAGHSLGEYGAAVAAGILTFEQALLAVSARGREMASIRLEDPGRMAGIATSAAVVDEVLAEVDGYVIAANKNCPTQTVIAGASDAVDEACERFRARGITVHPIPVSHAFHSAIVAPASEPLRGVLKRLGPKAPKRPITTNVTSEWYPTGPGAEDAIIDLLARQISAPVEWTDQIERMYDKGARIFLECGPKRALTGFAVAILKRRPHTALYTNHPKRGGVASFRDALAGLLVAGFPVRARPEAGLPDLLSEPAPRQAHSEALAAWVASRRPASPEPPSGPDEAHPDLTSGILRIVADATGYDVAELDLDYELEADLGIDTVKQAEVFSAVRETWQIPQDASFSLAEHRTLRSLIDWAAGRVGATRPAATRPVPPPPAPAPTPAAPTPAAPVVDAGALEAFARAVAAVEGLDARRFAEAMLPALHGLVQAAFDAARVRATPPQPAPAAAPVVRRPEGEVRVACTGASVGLPGGDAVFAADNFARILVGENRIEPLGDRAKEFLDLALVRLVKDARSGEGSFLPVDDVSQVIRLAGTKAGFDIAAWGVDPEFARALDVTTTLAIAAGLEALRDAGIPLVRTYKTTQGGKKVPLGWGLPEPLRDTTGVVFASAFPGYSQLIDKLASNGDDGEGRFDRRFLFQILSMGHSQLAQFIGARGPNTQVNAACASTTQAVAIAEDWIRVGRCERVIVVGADDVTNEQLLKWIGGGFMAAGAATTEADVTRAALPFDRRRHGMIIGMGAVGLVIERADEARARGVVPIAELLGSVVANSAFHGSRLDTAHIVDQMKKVVATATARAGVSAADVAGSALFMSHETYTPARGGSAAAEIEALRSAFGSKAGEITIANTKGFTGHAMGAGIEDAVALKALQYGRIPPIANFREPDEQLGDLRISRGERRRVDYAVRLAAGFGSQVAITVWKRLADGDDRVDPAVRAAWLRRVTGFDEVAERVEDRTLRAEPARATRLEPLPRAFPDEVPARPEPASPGATLEPAPPRVASGGALADLTALIAEKTGYAPEELDPSFELEADLGIDTVKQAEIFGVLRERYGLVRDDGFRLADYPTIEGLAAYLSARKAPRETPEPVVRTAAPDVERAFDLAPRAATFGPPGPEPVDDASSRTLVPDTQSTPAPGERQEMPDEDAQAAAPTWTPPPERRDAVPPEPRWAPPSLPPSFRLRRPVLVDVPARPGDALGGRCARVVGEGPLAEAVREALRAAGARLDGAPDLVVDVGGDVTEAFHVARDLDAGRPRRWVAVTRTGGLDLPGPSARAFADGARAGFTKALGREWPECAVTVLDVASEQDDAEAAAAICAEAATAPIDEVFVRFRQRQAVAYRLEPLPPSAPLPGRPVVLLTGGARGITARVARAIAQRGPCRLALVGRGPAADLVEDLAVAKKRIREDLAKRHARVTPALIEAELDKVRRAHEVRTTLDDLRALGAEVRYYAADLADATVVSTLLAEIERDLGAVDFVVHGAGVEESRKIADKSDEAFRRVFDPKAAAGRALMEALPRAFFVSMGSVAGRFGNAGQVDYAAANDALARMCQASGRALHVDWTAWDDVGMAVRGGMRSLLSQRGVDLLPAEAGAGLLVDLMAARVTGEIVVAGRLGDFHPTSHHPLLDHVDLVGDGVIARRTLSLARDPWLADHAIEGTPVLPGVMGLEILAAAAMAASPGLPYVGARRVRFQRPVKVHRDEEVALIVEATLVDPFEVRCSLVSERTLRTGKIQRTEHFDAVVVLGEIMPPESLPSAFFPDETLTADAIYERFFHGPRFRVLDAVHGLSADGLVGEAHAESDGVVPGLATQPLALEAAFQAAGLHRMVTADQMALPSTLEEVRLFRPLDPGDVLSIMVHHDGVSYDIDVDGPHGPALRVRGFTLIDLDPLPPERRFPAPAEGRPRCFPERASTSPGAPPRASRPGRGYDDATARAVWGEEDVSAWLTAAEIAEIEGRGTDRRRHDRLAGRIAAKRALVRLTGVRPHAIRIRAATTGEPLAFVGAEPGPAVSISHREGRAVAVAVSRGRVGVDLERIEPRAEAFARDWFTDGERALTGGDPLRQTIVWSIKEAVLKALGTGMALSPRDVEVRSLGEGGADVVVHRAAEAAWKRLGGGIWRVTWRRDADAFVVVTARLPGSGG